MTQLVLCYAAAAAAIFGFAVNLGASPQKNKKAAANAATADSGIDQRAFIAFTSAVSASAESKHIMKYA